MRVYLCHHRFHLHIAIKLKGKRIVSSGVPLSPIPFRAKWQYEERTQVSKMLTDGVP